MSASPAPEGFTRKRTELCEDCLLREDLDLLGRVRKDRHSRVKDCTGCKGRGTVRLVRTLDPYWTGRGV